ARAARAVADRVRREEQRGDREHGDPPGAHGSIIPALAPGITKGASSTGSMLTFSTDPDVAEQQMNAIIFYLTAFGYIDGKFDFTEKTFVRIYIRQLVTARATASMPDAEPRLRD